MIWTILASVTPKHEVYGLSEADAIVHAVCYSRSQTDMKTDVEAAQQRAQNMREMVKKIIKANWNNQSLLGSQNVWQATTAPGERELSEMNISPVFFAVLLPIRFWYEE